MRKAIVFVPEVRVHNEWKAVKTWNELLNFILKVYKREVCLKQGSKTM
jgi:hypothetical protein